MLLVGRNTDVCDPAIPRRGPGSRQAPAEGMPRRSSRRRVSRIPSHIREQGPRDDIIPTILQCRERFGHHPYGLLGGIRWHRRRRRAAVRGTFRGPLARLFTSAVRPNREDGHARSQLGIRTQWRRALQFCSLHKVRITGHPVPMPVNSVTLRSGRRGRGRGGTPDLRFRREDGR